MFILFEFLAPVVLLPGRAGYFFSLLMENLTSRLLEYPSTLNIYKILLINLMTCVKNLIHV